MTRLILSLETLSPLFMGGANHQPELRAASIKGALRHWYRAVDSGYPAYETRYFGGTGPKEGQSPILLRIANMQPWQPMEWLDESELKSFKVGNGPDTRNGLKYIGFAFELPGGARKAIPPGVKFELHLLIPRKSELSQAGFDALLASLWLMCYVGGLGTRARRGFGSLALNDWRAEALPESWQKSFDALPLPNREKSKASWLEAFKQAIDLIQSYASGHGFQFGQKDKATQPSVEFRPDHLGPRTRFYLLDKGISGDIRSQWKSAVNKMGLMMQKQRAGSFVERGDIRGHARHLLRRNGGQQMDGQAPDRTAFGLPLSFRFLKLDKKPAHINFEFTPAGQDKRGNKRTRHPAPLWLRVQRINGELHPFISYLDGILPGESEGISVNEGGRPRPLAAPGDGAIQAFLKEVQHKSTEIMGSKQ